MNTYEQYVTRIGFRGVRQGRTRARDIVGCTFTDLDPKAIKACLGRAKSHRPDLFFYRIAKDKAIVIDTLRSRVLLGNGKSAVKALFRLVNKQ